MLLHFRLLSFFLLCFVGFAPSAHALDLRVAIGISPVSPNAVEVPGSLSSANEDLAREICRRISAHCKIEKILFNEVLPGIEAQKIDLGFGGFLRSLERDKRFAFSDSIGRSASRLLATSAVAQRFAGQEISLDNLRDVRLVVIANSLQQQYLEKIAKEHRLTVLSVASTNEALAALRHGAADFWLIPLMVAYTVIGREPSGSFEFVGQPEVEQGLGGTVHIALQKSAEDLLFQINKALAEIRADGTYTRIIRRYFPVSLD